MVEVVLPGCQSSIRISFLSKVNAQIVNVEVRKLGVSLSEMESVAHDVGLNTMSDLVRITYFDITGKDDSSTKEILEQNPKTMIVYGKLIQEDDFYKVIVEEDVDDGEEHNSYMIPVGCVLDVTYLREGTSYQPRIKIDKGVINVPSTHEIKRNIKQKSTSVEENTASSGETTKQD